MEKEQTGRNRSNFLVQGGILALAGIVVRLIGLAYRIPLIRIIGDEGSGYYSVAYELYSVILLLSSYSLPLSVSKMISARLARKEYGNAKRVLKTALLYATIIGGLGCAVVWFGADWFAAEFYKLPLSGYALKSLAPTIWIMAYLGVFRGYYQGQSTMVPTALSQIFEQVVNAGVSIGAAWLLCETALRSAQPDDVVKGWGAAGGTIGTGAGALTALLILLIMYLRKKRYFDFEEGGKYKATESYRDITAGLLVTVIPVILSSLIYNLNNIVDSYLFPTIYEKLYNADPSDIAVQLGAYSGKYRTLINIPIAISNALASSIIPVLSRASSSGNKEERDRSINLAIKYSMLVGLPAACGITVLGEPIVGWLFGDSTFTAQLTLYTSSVIAFYCLSTVMNAILQGCSRMKVPVINAAIGMAIHIVFLVVILRFFDIGILGVGLANLVFAFVICVLNTISIRKLDCRTPVLKTYILPAICSIVMGWAVYYLRILCTEYVSGSNAVVCVFCIGSAGVIYLVLITITRCISVNELISRGRPGR